MTKLWGGYPAGRERNEEYFRALVRPVLGLVKNDLPDGKPEGVETCVPE